MKRKSLFGVMMLSLVITVFNSCSDNPEAKSVLEKVPASSDYVVIGDFATIIESAGGSVNGSEVELPSYLFASMSGSDATEINDLFNKIKESGIELGACAMTGNYKTGEPIFIAQITDEQKAKAFLDENDFSEITSVNGGAVYSKVTYESSYDSYWNRYLYAAIADNYAYIAGPTSAERNIPNVIARLIDDAKESSFADSPYVSTITAGNALGFAVKIGSDVRAVLREEGMFDQMAQMFDGAICGYANIDGEKAEAVVKWLDETGKAKNFKDMQFFDTNAKISKKALSFMSPDEQLVFAASMKDCDWDACFDQVMHSTNLPRSAVAQLVVAKSYLEKIDGTLALGVGLTGGTEAIRALDRMRDPLQYVSITAVIETKDGKAKGLVSDVENLLRANNMWVESTTDGFYCVVPDLDGSIYCEVKDNFIVIADHKIESDNNAVVDKFNFSKYGCAIGLAFDGSHELMQDFDLDNEVAALLTSDYSKSEMCLQVEVSGKNSAGIICNIAKMMIAVAEKNNRRYR